MIEKNKFYHCDCMELMKQMPDKFIDLAIVDPPYGGGSRERESCKAGGQTSSNETGQDLADSLTSTISATRTGGTWSMKYQAAAHLH